jgi:hypothetical protein
VVDASCSSRDEGRDPKGGALRPLGWVARFSQARRAARRPQDSEGGGRARGRMKPHRKVGRTVDGEAAWARVKIRGRGGSGKPNVPAIRPHTRLRGATDLQEREHSTGSTRAAQRQARLEPPKGKDVLGRTFGSPPFEAKAERPEISGGFLTGSTRRRDAARRRSETRRVPGSFPERTRSQADEAAKVRSRTGRTFRLCAEV